MGQQHVPFIKKDNTAATKATEDNFRQVVKKALGDKRTEEALKQAPKKIPDLDFNSPISQEKKQLANGMAYFAWLAKKATEYLESLWNKEKNWHEPLVRRSAVLDFGADTERAILPKPDSSDVKYNARNSGDMASVINNIIKDLIKKFVKALDGFVKSKEALNVVHAEIYSGLKDVFAGSGVRTPEEDIVRQEVDKIADAHKERMRLADTDTKKQEVQTRTKEDINQAVSLLVSEAVAKDPVLKEQLVSKLCNVMTPRSLERVSEHRADMSERAREVDDVLHKAKTLQQSSSVAANHPGLKQLVDEARRVQQQAAHQQKSSAESKTAPRPQPHPTGSGRHG